MTSTTNTTTTCPVTTVTNAGSQTITLGQTRSVNFEARKFSYAFGLPTEIIQSIALYCLSNGDIEGFVRLRTTGLHCYFSTQQLMNDKSLQRSFLQHCPGLILMDAEAQGLSIPNEPLVEQPLELLNLCYKMATVVEKNKETPAHLALLTISKEDTLNEVIEYAKKAGIEIEIYNDDILVERGNKSEPETYRVAISTGPITETRNKSYHNQIQRVKAVGFEDLPTLIEYLKLLISTQKELKICLYGQDPSTYGRSSTLLKNQWPLLIGGPAAGRVLVYYHSHAGFDGESVGAGGRRKF